MPAGIGRLFVVTCARGVHVGFQWLSGVSARGLEAMGHSGFCAGPASTRPRLDVGLSGQNSQPLPGIEVPAPWPAGLSAVLVGGRLELDCGAACPRICLRPVLNGSPALGSGQGGRAVLRRACACPLGAPGGFGGAEPPQRWL